MSLLRWYRRFTAWVALLALVFGALAPAVSHAVLMDGDRAGWLQVCGVSGMVWVQAETGEMSEQQPDGGAPMAKGSPHCAWCTLHGGAAGLPAVSWFSEPPPHLTERPARFGEVPLVAAVWVPAQSRAPPLPA